MTQTQTPMTYLSPSEVTTLQSHLKAAMSALDACGQDDLSDAVKTIFKTVAGRVFPTPVMTVLPPAGACCANDLWDIVLPADVEAANYNTHCFDWMEGRCGNCDCRSGGQWSRFACADNSVVKATAITFEDFQASLAR